RYEATLLGSELDGSETDFLAVPHIGDAPECDDDAAEYDQHDSNDYERLHVSSLFPAPCRRMQDRTATAGPGGKLPVAVNSVNLAVSRRFCRQRRRVPAPASNNVAGADSRRYNAARIWDT